MHALCLSCAGSIPSAGCWQKPLSRPSRASPAPAGTAQKREARQRFGPLEDKPMDDIKQAVVEALEEEGYESQIEEDGDISFEVDEDTYYVCFSSEDDEQDYFRVIWLSDSYDADRRVELLEQLNELTSSYRVAKTYLTDGDDGTLFVTCAVETYADVESFVQYLGDYIGILQEAVSELPEC
jgi:hypothetical protein